MRYDKEQYWWWWDGDSSTSARAAVLICCVFGHLDAEQKDMISEYPSLRHLRFRRQKHVVPRGTLIRVIRKILIKEGYEVNIPPNQRKINDNT